MTWTAANGTTPDGSIHNTGTFSTNGGLTTHAVGNVVVMIATCHNPTSGNEWCTGFTSSTPNTGPWTQITPTHNDVNSDLSIDSANDVWGGNIWAATVTAVSTDSNLAPTFSGPDNPPFYTNFVAMEFHSSVGSWYLDGWTFLNTTASNNTWPAVPVSGSGRLYIGYAWDASSALYSGSNPDVNGFWYNANADTTNNAFVFNLNYAGTTHPVFDAGDTTEHWGLMAALAEGSPSSGGPPVLPYIGGQVRQRQRQARRQQVFPGPASLTTAIAYATSQDIVAGGTGSWVNPGNADGAPDGAYATWTAP